MLTAWTPQQRRSQVVYLRTYTPNRNLIVRLWHFMRLKVINFPYYPCHSVFRAAIEPAMRSAKVYKSELQSLLALN